MNDFVRFLLGMISGGICIAFGIGIGFKWGKAFAAECMNLGAERLYSLTKAERDAEVREAGF